MPVFVCLSRMYELHHHERHGLELVGVFHELEGSRALFARPDGGGVYRADAGGQSLTLERVQAADPRSTGPNSLSAYQEGANLHRS